MKTFKLKSIAALMAIGSLMVGCSSSPEKVDSYNKPVVERVQGDECVFPRTDQEAPKWVCSDLSEYDGLYAVGIAEPTKGSVGLQRKVAMLDAKSIIISKLKSKVSSMVKSYVGTTGQGDLETVDTVAESVQKEVSYANLTGVNRKAMIYDRNGRLYVLAGINPNEAKKMLKTALMTSYSNQQALWQKLQADKAFKELKEEVEHAY